MNTYRYTLERYRGLSTRYTCPQCGRKHTFTRYIDTENNNQYISDNVGKCNRLDKCGYHYTPKQYFTDNPHRRDNFLVVDGSLRPFADNPWKRENRDECSFVRTNRENERTNANRVSSRPAPPKPTVSVLPEGIVRATEGGDSAHMRWIEHTYGTGSRRRVQSLYRTGGVEDAVIFWQRDIEGRVRTGKIMHYDEWSGKRLKQEGSIGWVHSIMRREGELPEEWELRQCLYGEHLLKEYPDKIVAVVEAYKTAHVGAILMPDMVWLATDSLQGLTAERLAPLKGRMVLFYPDEGKGYELWSQRLPQIAQEVGFKYQLSTFMEGKGDGVDIADIP
ncbi:MAG: hypothetical protein J6V55_05110 [Alistipes sp.]|nr:hypothetical protein [Alistipes sp.]